MKVTKVFQVSDATLTSTSVSEDDHAEWLVGETYALGDKRVVLSTHSVYQSLQNGNSGNDPTAEVQDDPDNVPVWWVRLGATNAWKAFDGLRNNQTVDSGPMSYVITPDVAVDSISLLNVDAQDVDVTVKFGSETIYSKSFNLSSRVVSNWYEFFFKPFQQKRNIVIDGLPPLIGTEISVTLTRDVGDIKLGILAVGNALFIGSALYGAESNIRSFSRTEPNEFGVTNLVVRPSKVITKQQVTADKALTTFLHELREDLEATPSVWSTLDDGDDDYANAYIINGIADRFVINANNPEQVLLELELREI